MIKKAILSVPVLGATAAIAHAHPGGHSEYTVSALLSHVMQDPFHAGMLVLGAVVLSVAAGGLLRAVRNRLR